MTLPKNFAAEAIFAKLRAILAPHAKHLTNVRDESGNYWLESGYSEQWKKRVCLAGAAIKKNYVSFHLIAVYAHPAMLEAISPELRKRMQGKSCFNFTEPDEKLLKELSALTTRAFAYYEKAKWIPARGGRR